LPAISYGLPFEFDTGNATVDAETLR